MILLDLVMSLFPQFKTQCNNRFLLLAFIYASMATLFPVGFNLTTHGSRHFYGVTVKI
jgi:hypothetical protein